MCMGNVNQWFYSLMGKYPAACPKDHSWGRMMNRHAELVSASILRTLKCRSTASRTAGQV